MSNNLRNDNECQNCGYSVELAYCSKCGQKNTETRQPFHHLCTHFIEDLTHYDGAFWKTILYLLFRPAYLTQEYLLGKRQFFVPPVKLYIFISFVTFFMMSMIITPEQDEHIAAKSTAGVHAEDLSTGGKKPIVYFDGGYSTVEDFEAQERALPEEERKGPVLYWLVKKLVAANEKQLSDAQILLGFIHTIPKVLFIYMPLFAFWLWLFHGKKRWYFFDHGIFTLHYFSFLLLLCVIVMTLRGIINLIFPENIRGDIFSIFSFIFMIYAFFYFFRSHSRMYGEKRWVSRLKGILLFIINMILIGGAIFATAIYAFINVH